MIDMRLRAPAYRTWLARYFVQASRAAACAEPQTTFSPLTRTRELQYQHASLPLYQCSHGCTFRWKLASAQPAVDLRDHKARSR